MIQLLDYYELDDPGCCLICEDAYDGCLCFNCKCSKCSMYSENDPESESIDENGKRYCVLTYTFSYDNQKLSTFKVHEISNRTNKAILCSIIDNNSKAVSENEFWIPFSVVNKENYIKNWFVEKELKNKFKKNQKPQRKLI